MSPSSVWTLPPNPFPGASSSFPASIAFTCCLSRTSAGLTPKVSTAGAGLDELDELDMAAVQARVAAAARGVLARASCGNL